MPVPSRGLRTEAPQGPRSAGPQLGRPLRRQVSAPRGRSPQRRHMRPRVPAKHWSLTTRQPHLHQTWPTPKARSLLRFPPQRRANAQAPVPELAISGPQAWTPGQFRLRPPGPRAPSPSQTSLLSTVRTPPWVALIPSRPRPGHLSRTVGPKLRLTSPTSPNRLRTPRSQRSSPDLVRSAAPRYRPPASNGASLASRSALPRPARSRRAAGFRRRRFLSSTTKPQQSEQSRRAPSRRTHRHPRKARRAPARPRTAGSRSRPRSRPPCPRPRRQCQGSPARAGVEASTETASGSTKGPPRRGVSPSPLSCRRIRPARPTGQPALSHTKADRLMLWTTRPCSSNCERP